MSKRRSEWYTRRIKQGIEAMRLRNKGTHYSVPFPDLSCESSATPTTDAIPVGSSAPRLLPRGAKQYSVGQSHKQGPMMVTPGMVANGELEYMGGKKT